MTQIYLHKKVLSLHKTVNPWARAKGLWREVRGIGSSWSNGCSLDTQNDRYRRVNFKGEKALQVSEHGQHSLTEDRLAVPRGMDPKMCPAPRGG